MAAVALLLFLPAGPLAYWNGWLFLGILFVPMLALGIFLLIKDPELLQKRLQTKETEPEQKTVAFLGGMMFLAYPLILVKCIRNEKQVLAERLEGYQEYRKTVRCRLIPLVW